MVHSSTLRRTWFTSAPRHTLAVVLPKATRPPNRCSPCTRGDQVEEGVGWIGRHEIARGAQLLPRQELPDQECKGERPPAHQADDPTPSMSSPARGHLCPLQRDTAQDQHARVEPQQPRHGQSPASPPCSCA